jgi:deazaflavin-dependent oxidoreductase (nitroreductase family)
VTDEEDGGGSGPVRTTDPGAEELAAWGRILLVETVGRRSGVPRVTPVGYVEEPDGSLLVAATSPDAAWAQDLLVTPGCRVGRSGRTERRIAVPLEGAAADQAVVALILRYGTPSEGLGSGPAFRLSATDSSDRA